MLKQVIIIAIMLVATSASAQSASPYKLIITWYQAGIVAVDYPTKARCEAARLAVMQAIEKRNGGTGGSDIAFCIPG